MKQMSNTVMVRSNARSGIIGHRYNGDSSTVNDENQLDLTIIADGEYLTYFFFVFLVILVFCFRHV